ncbi:MAG: rhomboid family intramembrane serine protease [Ignavibacteriaceae bacterium]
MNTEKKDFTKNIFYPVSFVILLWVIKLIEELFNISFLQYGLSPGEVSGLMGIIFAPLIHADYSHLIANSFPLLILGLGLFYFFPDASARVFLIIYFIPNIIVWFLGRNAYHIGASGIVYGLITFIFFSGVIRRDTRSIALSLVVTFLYGGFVWGVLPLDRRVSWESHLFGALTGMVCAVIFRKNDPYKKYEWEDEDNDDNEKPEISYTKGYPWED